MEVQTICIDDLLPTDTFAFRKRVDDLSAAYRANVNIRPIAVVEDLNNPGKYFIYEGHHRARAQYEIDRTRVQAYVIRTVKDVGLYASWEGQKHDPETTWDDVMNDVMDTRTWALKNGVNLVKDMEIREQ